MASSCWVCLYLIPKIPGETRNGHLLTKNFKTKRKKNASRKTQYPDSRRVFCVSLGHDKFIASPCRSHLFFLASSPPSPFSFSPSVVLFGLSVVVVHCVVSFVIVVVSRSVGDPYYWVHLDPIRPCSCKLCCIAGLEPRILSASSSAFHVLWFSSSVSPVSLLFSTYSSYSYGGTMY